MIYATIALIADPPTVPRESDAAVDVRLEPPGLRPALGSRFVTEPTSVSYWAHRESAPHGEAVV
jgi:hypothetical protein